MKRDPIRVALALALIVSAVLFVAGSIIERSHSATSAHPTSLQPAPVTTTVTPSTQATQSQAAPTQAAPTQGASSTPSQAGATGGEGSAQHEAAEHTHPTVPASPASQAPAPSPSQAVGVAGLQSSPAPPTPAEGNPQREAAEKGQRALGINLESAPLVAAAATGTLLFALAAVAWRRRAVLLVIAAFALSFGVLDVRELVVQAGTGRSSVVALAGVLAVVHLIAATLAMAASIRERSPIPASN